MLRLLHFGEPITIAVEVWQLADEVYAASQLFSLKYMQARWRENPSGYFACYCMAFTLFLNGPKIRGIWFAICRRRDCFGGWNSLYLALGITLINQSRGRLVLGTQHAWFKTQYYFGLLLLLCHSQMQDFFGLKLISKFVPWFVSIDNSTLSL